MELLAEGDDTAAKARERSKSKDKKKVLLQRKQEAGRKRSKSAKKLPRANEEGLSIFDRLYKKGVEMSKEKEKMVQRAKEEREMKELEEHCTF